MSSKIDNNFDVPTENTVCKWKHLQKPKLKLKVIQFKLAKTLMCDRHTVGQTDIRTVRHTQAT